MKWETTYNKRLNLPKPFVTHRAGHGPRQPSLQVKQRYTHEGELMEKDEHEREVFIEFAAAAGLNLDKESVRSAEPPEPDISCRVDGEERYFELTRVSDQNLANAFGETMTELKMGAESSVSRVVSYSDQDAVESAVKRKPEKATTLAELDLICCSTVTG